MSPPAPASPKRRWLAPEVIQTSAMDCGPAALKCLLGGFGIDASYGRLREACQTDVDGTSIDTLEAIGQALGLDVTQTMVPVDWLLLPEAEALPCLVVVQVPGGGTHFLVAWRRVGGWVQLMDPASGRRWVRCADFEREVYRHRQPLPAAAVRGWLGSDGPQALFAARLAALGVQGADAAALLEAAKADAGCRRLATLDAALRLAELLRERKALAKGEPARALVAALLAEPDRIPARLFAFEEDAAPGDGGDAIARLRGAVFLKVSGLKPEGASADLPPDLQAALAEPPPQPGKLLWELVRQGGAAPLWVIGAAAAVAAAGSVALGLALRALVDLRGELPLAGQRLFALGAIAALAAGLLLVEAPAVAALLRVARGLEMRLRLRFAEKLPRLADRYFRSRPRSDMAQRAHALQRVRLLPGLASRLLRAGLGMVACVAGMVWLDPGTALPAFLALLLAAGLPLLALPSLCEQDFKLKSHAGALTRFNLDSLLGHGALQAHGAHGAVGRAYRMLLGEWASAAGRFEAASIRIEVALLAILHGIAVWLLLAHLGRGSFGSLSLLLAWWALLLPAHALDFARALWQVPAVRTITLRLLEPLGALEDKPSEDGAQSPSDSGYSDEGMDPGLAGTLCRGDDRGNYADASILVPSAAANQQENPFGQDATFVTPAKRAGEAGAQSLSDSGYSDEGMDPGLAGTLCRGDDRGNYADASIPVPSAAVNRQLSTADPVRPASFVFEAVTVLAGGHTVLDSIDLTLAAGEHVAVVGPSGAGKSSLLGLLLGWHRPASGRVLWDGAPLDGLRLSVLRSATAWIDPEVQLWNQSLLDNLAYGAAEGALAGVGRVLADAELEPVVEKLRTGLATPLGEGGARFSGGEGQRVRIGRALLRPQVRLVLLDEPFRGLTREGRERLLARLREVYRGVTLIFISHDVQQALTFPRVVVVENGRVAEDGPPAALMAIPEGRLASLVRTEESLRDRLRHDAGWRRLHLDEGRLVETSIAGAAP